MVYSLDAFNSAKRDEIFEFKCEHCGKPFTKITSLAKHKVTCSPACKALRIKAMSTGRQFNEETRAKMSDSHKTEKAYEHLDEIRSASTEALLKAPRRLSVLIPHGRGKG